MKERKLNFIHILRIWSAVYFTVIFPAVWHMRTFLADLSGHYMISVFVGHMIMLSLVIHIVAAICSVWYSISAYIKEKLYVKCAVTSCAVLIIVLFTVYVTSIFPISDLYCKLNRQTRSEERESYIIDLTKQYSDSENVLPYVIPLEYMDNKLYGWYLSSDNSVFVSKNNGRLTVAFTVGTVPAAGGKTVRELIFVSDGVKPNEQELAERYDFSFMKYDLELLSVTPLEDNTFDVKYRIYE